MDDRGSQVERRRQMDWYDENIEARMRDIVRLLRNNGINTTYSCHHAMVTEAENYSDNEITRVYDLLIEAGYDDFVIQMVFYKSAGCSLRRHFEIYFDPSIRRPLCRPCNAKLAAPVSEEAAELLEQLAIHVPYTFHTGTGIATQARELAACIRELTKGKKNE